MINAVVIGSGFSSLATACLLVKYGIKVTVLEKNDYLGGRARVLKKDGFQFDMGPTFYWMPDVFETFFAQFEKTPQDYYQLQRLSPAYQVYFGPKKSIKVGKTYEETRAHFEKIDPTAGRGLDTFIKQAKENYEIAIKDLVYQPGQSILELINWTTFKKSKLFVSSIKKQIEAFIHHPQLRTILEFPVLFLGATPKATPAFYNFMNYADLVLGTWHPQGGMHSVINGMVTLGKSLGVSFLTNNPVHGFVTENHSITGVKVGQKTYKADVVVSGADYAHTETLLDKKFRQYSPKFWSKKTFAPSALLFYVGFNKKLDHVSHHTLCFDTDFDTHASDIYNTKQWPKDPLFYCSFPSISDALAAPEGKEAGIFLIPISPGLNDTLELRDFYFNLIIKRLEKLTKQNIKSHILFKESFCVNDFKKDYNAYKGNAYGLANTLLQTHILRPRLKNKKLTNLFYSGQLTLPGPGVPPALISGMIVSNLIKSQFL